MATPSAIEAVNEGQHVDDESGATVIKIVTEASANRRKALRLAKVIEKNIDKNKMTDTIAAILYITHVILDDWTPDEEDEDVIAQAVDFIKITVTLECLGNYNELWDHAIFMMMKYLLKVLNLGAGINVVLHREWVVKALYPEASCEEVMAQWKAGEELFHLSPRPRRYEHRNVGDRSQMPASTFRSQMTRIDLSPRPDVIGMCGTQQKLASVKNVTSGLTDEVISERLERPATISSAERDKKISAVINCMKDKKFSGASDDENIRTAVRDFVDIITQFGVDRPDRLSLLRHAFSGRAYDYVTEHVLPVCTELGHAVQMLHIAYDTPAKQSRMRAKLQAISFERYVQERRKDNTEHVSVAHVRALDDIIKDINIWVPLAPPDFRKDSHYAEFLRNAVLGQPWASKALSDSAQGEISYDSLCSHLQNALQLSIDEKSRQSMTKSQIIEGTDIMFGVPAVSHYGTYPQSSRSHSAGNQVAGNTTGRLNSKEDRHCYACGEKGHYARDKKCKRDNIRRYQETRVRYGECEVTDAFAVLEDMDEHCGIVYSGDNGSQESDLVIRSSTDQTNYVVAAHPANAEEAMEIARVDAYMARQFSIGELGADFR
jgi:hypothetical protein